MGQANVSQFTRYTSEDGLPSMEVYKVQQDTNGYIWIGTAGGLCRYDGYEFKTLTTKDGLPNNEVLNLKLDSHNRLWIGSFGPLCYLKDNKFVQPKLVVKEPSHSGFKIIERGLDTLIIGFGRAVFIQTSPTDSIKPYLVDGEPLNGRVKVVGFQADTLILNKGDNLLRVFNNRLIDSIPVPNLRSLYHYDLQYFTIRGDWVYYNTQNGLVSTNLKSLESKVLDPGVRHLGQIEFLDDRLWITTNSQGIFVYELSTNNEKVIKTEFFKKTGLSQIVKDQEGNFWIPDYGGGLYYVPEAAKWINVFSTANGLIENRIESILVHGDSLLLGSFSSSIQILEQDNVSTLQIGNYQNRPINRVLDIIHIDKDEYLLATDLGIIEVRDGKQQLLLRNAIKSLTYNPVREEFVMTAYIGAYVIPKAYLDTVRKSVNVNAKIKDGVPKAFKSLYSKRSYGGWMDNDGTIWVGSAFEGLIQFPPKGSPVYWRDKSNIFQSTVKKIYRRADGTLVLGTLGEGIIFIKGEDYFQIDQEAGLSGNLCDDFIIDEDKVWVATNRGISGILGFNWDDPERYSLKILDRNDGLITNSIRTVKKRGNDLVLGTHRGLMIFDETTLDMAQSVPRILLRDVLVNGNSQDRSKPIELSWEENNVQFQVVGISFLSRRNLKYEYKLHGFDSDYKVTKALDISYTNLPPGPYTFKVRAIGDGGAMSKIEQVSFEIFPHFTNTLIFQGIMIFLFLALMLLVMQMAANYRQRNILEKVVESKTEELNQQVEILADTNEKLARSNKELEQYAHVASHDLKSPLRHVAGFIQLLKRKAASKLSSEEKEYIDLAVKGVRQMNEVTNDLLMMAKVDQLEGEKEEVDMQVLLDEVLSGLKGIIESSKAEINITTDLPTLYFSKTNAKQLFQNLITNAIKYQNGGVPKVEVSVIKENGYWKFAVQDNGIGIDMAYQDKVFEMFQRLHHKDQFSGTGIGLAICKKIIERNNGRIWFDSTLNKGTTFYFTIPYHKTLETSNPTMLN